MPAFVRVTGELPKLASMKIDKQRLRREVWLSEPVFWRPGRDAALREMTPEDRASLARLLRPAQ